VLFFLIIGACGRVNFDAAPQCDVFAPFDSITPLAALNGPGGDGGLRLTDDERTAYFHSNRSGVHAIYSATRASRSHAFGAPVLLYSEAVNLYWPFPLRDQTQMVFDDDGDIVGVSRASTADAFGSRTVVVSSPLPDAHPYVVRDSLYFTRFNQEGAIYVASWPGGVVAGTVGGLETFEEERSPTVAADERTIYFGRRNGTGDLDVWTAHRADASLGFVAPVRVAELTTGTDESPTWLSPDGCRLYFEATRTGNFDLFVAERALP